ncbi:hypothetical protein R0137_02425 [Congregibacter brevis]|uniref:Uncharacterized protein n=1 Tax=Congregibacter brevis TaxID=3081201 RepID=A0ABZ0ID25_9GAMM|nr:hypothetical protein R0137_02425 [Congregibacter sp. IMCC45268]
MHSSKNSGSSMLLVAAIAAGAVSFVGTTLADNTATAGKNEYRWETDMRGKPPYKRQRVAIETVDIASMEISDSEVAMEEVRTRSFTGRPPFDRRIVELPVVDAASMELVEEQMKATTFRGRPPFRRHR